MYKLVPEKHNEGVPESCGEVFKTYLSHMFFEFLGTLLMSLAFNVSGFGGIDQVGGYAIAMMICCSVSGAQLNPAITMICMLRRDNKKISVKMGLCFIAVQYLAGFCGALMALLVIGNDGINALNVAEWYSSIIAISLGSFINVFMYAT
mmetsp:Transcript_13186/g.9254  ORF Transcript_13186/g.9254 Transcript_13186/m.9254 type:complete len:149 (-) Transcript_13186:481-927(-)